MVCMNILAGGYDVFVALYCFNPANSSLTLTSTFPTGQNPSWITRSVIDSNAMYATNEVGPVGAIQSFDVNGGQMSRVHATVSSLGDSPAFAAELSNGDIAVLNYNTGDGRFIPTYPSSQISLDDDSAPLITFPKNPSTNVSHPHMALEHDGEVLISDLGADQIWRLTNDVVPGYYSIKGNIPQPAGSGPRHIAVRDNMLFVLHELASTLTVQPIPAKPNGTSTILDTKSIIPAQQPAGAEYGAAEILMVSTAPYIYVSNRNIGTPDPSGKGDSVAIFDFDQASGKLTLVNQFYTGLDQIRGMEFDASGKYLVAAGVAGTAGTKVFEMTDSGKNFTEVASNLEIPTRTSFIWV